MPAGPLAGVRVLDVTSTFMGPYCTLLMAQMGADVLKVEAPSGDLVRYVSDRRGTGMGPIFLNANRGKRSIVLDLADPEGRELLGRLAAEHDVFVHNVRPDAEKKLAITYADIAAVNPTVVHCSLYGFSSAGPYHGQPAYDDVIQAASGLAASQGTAGAPEYVRTVVADKVAALMALGSINAALYHRAVTGVGQAVEVPMLETLVGFTMLEQQAGYVYDPPTGPAGYARTASPHRRPYRTADGHVSTMIYTDRHWRSFFALIGRPELADDPRYATITARTEHIDELYELVAAVLTTRTTAQWREALEKAGIPVMPVNSLADVFSDPQIAAAGLFEHVEHPTEGTLRLARPAVGFSVSGHAEIRPGPRLGEHTAEVLAGLGLDAPEIERLTLAGACAPRRGPTPPAAEAAG
ncbi:CaiB/BaiF CoA transferase family protein [Pseudonocardia bannensis]|uniref:CoA transferase n=1 Tax=Pseudonocardia bannensis TaxID=630973 RepID=A0A848DPD5_9PSEU|nr:CoA transferase [Pseudonocardia bannensis]NMH94369.1 CoA transferase [Pseudonocardia bannensis]